MITVLAGVERNISLVVVKFLNFILAAFSDFLYTEEKVMFDYQYFKSELKDIKENFDVIRGFFDLDNLNKKLEEYSIMMEDTKFWDDVENSTRIVRISKSLKR